MTTITARQIRDLWISPNHATTIDRGDDLPPVTREDIIALCEGGDVEWNDRTGEPTDAGYELLADQFNTEQPGETTNSHADLALATIEELAARRRAAIAKIDAELAPERDDAIRAAITAGVPVTAIAAAAGLHRQRVYQIRDGRR